MKQVRTCHICGTQTDDNCPNCMANFKYLPDPKTMTTDEKVKELESWGGILEIPFSMMHGRIEALVGRPVFTHELANYDKVIDEVRRKQ